MLTEHQQRIFDKMTTKPRWVRDAVLTHRGWQNPATGELLLGRRTPQWVFDELERLEDLKKSKQVEPAVDKTPPIESESDPVVEVKEQVSEDTPKTKVKSRRKAKPKKVTDDE